MNIIKTKLLGVYIIEPDVFRDERGAFAKVFHKDTFIKGGMAFGFEESYYSLSKKNVLRGMHFQTPPKDHAKLVYVTAGAITDVVLDIRKGSLTYGQYIARELSDENHIMMYIPTGCAHGFLSLRDDSCVVYMQTSMYAPKHDGGIRIDSFGMEWHVQDPIISQRDQSFPAFQKFKTPFIHT